MNIFLKLKFAEDDKGKIHIFTEMPNEDNDGFFITSNQQKGLFFLLDALKETISKNDLESLK